MYRFGLYLNVVEGVANAVERFEELVVEQLLLTYMATLITYITTRMTHITTRMTHMTTRITHMTTRMTHITTHITHIAAHTKKVYLDVVEGVANAVERFEELVVEQLLRVRAHPRRVAPVCDCISASRLP